MDAFKAIEDMGGISRSGGAGRTGNGVGGFDAQLGPLVDDFEGRDLSEAASSRSGSEADMGG